jgi:hypothetical protein
MPEPLHTLRVSLPWALWLELRRFCRHYGYDEADYIAWLIGRTRRTGVAGTFPLPSVFESRGLQHFDEA